MKITILSLIVTVLGCHAFASNPCEAQFTKAIQKAAYANNVSISTDSDLGVTSSKGEEHYSVMAYYSDRACDSDSQTFQIYTKKGSCAVEAIHANGDEDCGD
jgi:hypothetical protein